MMLTWQFNDEEIIVLLKFGELALAADFVTYNIAMEADPARRDFVHLIDLRETDCEQSVFIDLVSPIEEMLHRVIRSHHPKIAFLADNKSQIQLTRFFTAVKDLMPESEAVNVYVSNDRSAALAWLKHVR
tara:strand:- start:973 stop:1362 length:390 start_codon:yes stop_codon:yes gene_type:complete